jgi:hypothetical protein
MSLPTLLSGFALTVAVGAGALLYGQNQDLKERLAAVETMAAAETDAADPAAPGSPMLRGGRTAREVAEVRRLTNALVQRVDEQETRLEAIAEAGGDGSAAPVAAASLRTAAFTDAVREVVLEMAGNDAAFRSKVGSQDRTKLPKNSSFAKLATVLELDAAQESQMSKDLQGMQQELFGILSEERDDGVVPMEMIAKAEGLKEGDPKRAELFIQLFTLKIPGREETYMQRAVKLQGDFRKRTTDYLRPAQLEIWQNLEVDLFSVKFD